MQYYVDSRFGCDDNDGLAPMTPWQSLEKINAATFLPGDEILLAADSVFEGQLHPKGDGTAEAPIRIRSYGGGRKPCIDGCGTRYHGKITDSFIKEDLPSPYLVTGGEQVFTVVWVRCAIEISL